MQAGEKETDQYGGLFRALEADAQGNTVGQTDERANPYGFEDSAAATAAAHARLDWQHFDCELFALLAERHPEHLTGPHGILLAVVKAQEELWAYPTARLDDDEVVVKPYLDVDALRERWSELRMRAWQAF